MGENSKIEWCDHTFNAWWGCEKVSAACKNCYAETRDARFGGKHWGPGSDRKVMSDKYWEQLGKWHLVAEMAGTRPRIFVNSMSDLFEDHPQVIAARYRLFMQVEQLISLDFIFLTKRPDNVMRMVPESWHRAFPKNVLMGTTVEDQETADKRIPILLSIPSTVHFLSCEPLLSFITIPSGAMEGPSSIDWVICGGESGRLARPMHPSWAIWLLRQCSENDILFFFKQWGEWLPVDDLPNYFDFRDGPVVTVPVYPDYKPFGPEVKLSAGPVYMARIGKKLAGRHFDGKIWDQVPGPGLNFSKNV